MKSKFSGRTVALFTVPVTVTVTGGCSNSDGGGERHVQGFGGQT
jgi:hypothetical protein